MRRAALARWLAGAAPLVLLAAALGSCAAPETIGPRPDVAAVAGELERLIAREIDEKGIPALSIAIVDDGETVWARGFGFEDPAAQTPATARTVYRVGSVSKLFTDLAVMALVESGSVDLDAPVTRYIPDFTPRNSYDRPLTLRQLMTHRAGLVRESPVGHYFDPDEPTLAATVASLNSTELVYAPEARTKYSNAGIAVVGYVLERLASEPFAAHIERTLLSRLGMQSSSFTLGPRIRSRLAKANMWTLDGRTFPAPDFAIGTSPAGNLYSTVADQARFLSFLFARGRSEDAQIVTPETLEAMWQPQFVPAGERRGFGLGFFVSDFDGRRLVGHNGAVYGFATALAALPDEKLGVVVAASLDVANAVTDRVARHALRLLLAQRNGTQAPALPTLTTVDPETALRFAGRYQCDKEALELEERGGGLFALLGAHLTELRAGGKDLVADGRLGNGARLTPAADGLSILHNGKTFTRVPDVRPEPAPERWHGFLGEYGWDHNVLYVLEKDQVLHVLIEWFDLYPLTEVSPDVFAFPDYGLYHGEKLFFRRDAEGVAKEVEAASVVFRRRSASPSATKTFRIDPLRPLEDLRKEALDSTPPAQDHGLVAPVFVDLAGLDPTIAFDIRYAGTNNFLGAKVYEEARAFLVQPAAEALLRVHRSLAELGFGLLIHDAYRPWYVTKVFWEATPAAMRDFVADPAEGSRHNRGCAVDLTLYELATGRPVRVTSGYDEFSERAYPHYPGGTSLERWHSRLLRRAMSREGFTVYEYEWWHFDYKDWKRHPVLNRSFAEADGEVSTESRRIGS